MYSTTTQRISLIAIFLVAGACSTTSSKDWKQELTAPANPFTAQDPLWAEQPLRDHPYVVLLSADDDRLYVTLQGTPDDPGHEVVVVDTATEAVRKRITVGSHPSGLALDPSGRYMVVANPLSNYLSVIDTKSDKVTLDIPVPFYTMDVAFTPDGAHLYATNRWKDSVLRLDVDTSKGFSVTGDNYSDAAEDSAMGIAVGDNPRDLAVSPDGKTLFVVGITGMELSIIEVGSDIELERVWLNSPLADVVASNSQIFTTHIGRGTHHRPDDGFDTNNDGLPGDGTANVMFGDLQNEIAVLSHQGELLKNYTADTMCCGDFRDVDPDTPGRGALLPAPDTWPASRLDFLPPKTDWQVGCALPEQMALHQSVLAVVCSGSNEVQTFNVAQDGSLSARETAGGLYKTGMNPHGITISADGSTAYVAERLGEYVTVLDLQAGPGAERRILVGNVEGGEFPATDAELGEAFNSVTGPFSIDGDQTCVHCHREGNNMAKTFGMPLQEDAIYGTRMPMAYRAAADTRPWFLEGGMDETNFFPVINEFSRKENFCCELSDPLIWSAYPTTAECAADSGLTGCNHVQNCPSDPPPECASRNYGSTYLTRDEHFLGVSMDVFGRQEAFGDVLRDLEDPSRPVALDFRGIARTVGLFLLQKPRLLPNPYAALPEDTAFAQSAKRGRGLYQSIATGCDTCHPLPLTTVTEDFNPFAMPLRFAPLVTPRLNPITGEDADRAVAGFLAAFPGVLQDEAGLYIGVPQLRGIWDRAAMFYHDGRAPSLHEALASPGHARLEAGEVGHNETYGMADTHGATSHLTAKQLEDLVAFLLTL